MEIKTESTDINLKDLKIEVIPSNWVWVYKPDTEIEITHIPTGYKVRCNETRSQYQNREIALREMKAYLENTVC